MNMQEHDPGSILDERAKWLARRREDDTPVEATVELLEFRLAQETYAVEHRWVVEASPFKELTPLPCTPPFIRGVINLRGRILPVLDLKRFFDLPEKGITDLHRIIFVRGNEMEFGLLADSVTGVQVLPERMLQPSLPTLTGIRADYLKGVTAGRLVVLDLQRIFTDPRILVNEEVEG